MSLTTDGVGLSLAAPHSLSRHCQMKPQPLLLLLTTKEEISLTQIVML